MEKRIFKNVLVLIVVVLLLSATLMLFAFYNTYRNELLLATGQNIAFVNYLLRMLQPLLLGFGVLLLLGIVLSKWVAKRMVKPLLNVELSELDEDGIYQELIPLLEQAMQIQHHSDQKQKTKYMAKEYEIISNQLQQGLIVFNTSGQILSINQSASDLLALPVQQCIGKEIHEITSSLPLQHVVCDALEGKVAKEMLARNDKMYQLFAAPVVEEGLEGIIVTIEDVTAMHETERIQKLFLESVSKEFSTPLKSIINDIKYMEVKLPEDRQLRNATERIQNEANKMIGITEDIYHFTSLKEAPKDDKTQWVDLYQQAQLVIEELTPLAQEQHVTLLLTGESAKVQGNAEILREMIRHLALNAIQFNKEEGSATLHVAKQKGDVLLTVVDTGSGIAKREQQKVFEKFYRGKNAPTLEGGVGLGLAIVKHGAMYHKAKIEMRSKENEGTVIRLTFPQAE